jgi:hypothetical protein
MYRRKRSPRRDDAGLLLFCTQRLLAAFLAFDEEFRDSIHEGTSGGVDGDFAGEDIAVVDVLAVVGGGVFLVLVDEVAGEIEAGEKTFAA